MQNTNSGTQFLSNSKYFLEGLSRGIEFVNDSVITPLAIKECTHPCFAYELTVIDADADTLEQSFDSKSHTITATSSEFILFYFMNKYLPEDAYFDDTLIKQNGSVITNIVLENIPEHATMTMEYGFVYGKDGEELGRIQDAFLAWKARKSQA